MSQSGEGLGGGSPSLPAAPYLAQRRGELPPHPRRLPAAAPGPGDAEPRRRSSAGRAESRARGRPSTPRGRARRGEGRGRGCARSPLPPCLPSLPFSLPAAQPPRRPGVPSCKLPSFLLFFSFSLISAALPTRTPRGAPPTYPGAARPPRAPCWASRASVGEHRPWGAAGVPGVALQRQEPSLLPHGHGQRP